MNQKQMIAVTLCVCLLVCALACVLSPVSWSPDGKWIAFMHFLTKKKADGKAEDVVGSELWIASPSPIERRRLAVTSGTLSGPAWSADSKTVYFVEFEEKADSKSATLRQSSLDGQLKDLARFGGVQESGNAAFASPAIAPDGRRIAFARDQASVAIVGSDGRQERIIETEKAGTLLWSPDGQWLGVICGDGDNTPAVRLVNARSSETFTLDVRFRTMAWLPDGKRFVAVRSESGDGGKKSFISVLERPTGPREVSSFAVDGTPAGPLVLTRRGDAVYFAREEQDSRPPAICGLDLRDGKQRVLYETPGPVCAWSVAPDGHALAFRESAPDDDSALESFVGVLDVRATTEPIYLGVSDAQWAKVVGAYVTRLKKIPTANLTPQDEKQAVFILAQAERLLAAFRRDFPKSPLLAQSSEAIKEVRAALKQAGATLSPEAGMPRW
jgi:Tol biopolymer transport system component